MLWTEENDLYLTAYTQLKSKLMNFLPLCIVSVGYAISSTFVFPFLGAPEAPRSIGNLFKTRYPLAETRVRRGCGNVAYGYSWPQLMYRGWGLRPCTFLASGSTRRGPRDGRRCPTGFRDDPRWRGQGDTRTPTRTSIHGVSDQPQLFQQLILRE